LSSYLKWHNMSNVQVTHETHTLVLILWA
jgi:hypothetical protein